MLMDRSHGCRGSQAGSADGTATTSRGTTRRWPAASTGSSIASLDSNSQPNDKICESGRAKPGGLPLTLGAIAGSSWDRYRLSTAHAACRCLSRSKNTTPFTTLLPISRFCWSRGGGAVVCRGGQASRPDHGNDDEASRSHCPRRR